MKKSTKQFVSLLLVALIFCSTFTTSALNQPKKDPVRQFSEFLSPLYFDSKYQFKIWDLNDRLVTETFLENTAAHFKNGDLESIYAYYQTHVSKIECIAPSKGRNGDISKTVVDRYVKLSAPSTWSHSGAPYTTNIQFDYYLTIYYNPNTYVISTATSSVFPANMTATLFENPSSPTISGNRYFATFPINPLFVEYLAEVNVIAAEWRVNFTRTVTSS